MADYASGPVVKVQITYEDGSVNTLTGEEAKKWGEVVASQGVFAWNHGMTCPVFKWEKTRAPEAEVAL